MIQRGNWSKEHLVKAVDYIKQNKDKYKELDHVYEWGVYRGESLRLIENLYYAHAIPLKKSFGIDSFQGLPEEAHGVPHFYLFQKGMFADVTFVYPINGIYIKSWFNELNESHVQEYSFKPAGLVHIDCDLYVSAFQALDFMFKHKLIVKDTVVAYDEFKSMEPLFDGGEAKAHKEITDKYKVRFKEFFRNVYVDQYDCWQNCFTVEEIGAEEPHMGLL